MVFKLAAVRHFGFSDRPSCSLPNTRYSKFQRSIKFGEPICVNMPPGGLVAVGVQEQAEDVLVPPLLRNCLTFSYIPLS